MESMDRVIPPERIRRRRIRRLATVVVAAGAILFSAAATLDWLRPAVSKRDIQIARVERGAVDATLQASGTLVPAF
jgi:hypothetical protein